MSSRFLWVFLASLWLCVVPATGNDLTKPRPWISYRTIMWIGDEAGRHPQQMGQFIGRLREMGINTGMIYSDADPAAWVEADFPYYVENLVNRGLCLKFNSRVQDWDKMVTEWAKTSRPQSALIRDYCLDDPAWLESAQATVRRIAARHASHHPVAYNLRDELSTTISANPFDYDFSPLALEQFRAWLKTQYRSLPELNEEWATRFESWQQVVPFTTDQIKNRMASGEAQPQGSPDWQRLQQLEFSAVNASAEPTRWNFAPWADFRSYMDLSLARALGALRATAQKSDPETPVGVEGTQMPAAFGGYDLWRLAQVLDWVEPYDIAGAREIFGSFMPNHPILTTVFEKETKMAQRRLWHLLLEGDRGCLVWWSEDCLRWNGSEWELTAKAKALAPVLKQMTSGLAKLFVNAERERDPLFIHYSQASIQADWLLESTVDGSTWLRRFSSYESEHNRMAKTRVAWLKALQDLGFTPQFLSSAQIESGGLDGISNAVLVLPESIALTDEELARLEKLRGGNTGRLLVLAEGPTGCFDGHARLRPSGSLSWLSSARTNTGCIALGAGTGGPILAPSRDYLKDRLHRRDDSQWFGWLRKQMSDWHPAVSVAPEARVRVHRYRAGIARLVAFERNVDYQMSESLKQAGGNQALETELNTRATLEHASHVFDLRTGQYVGLRANFEFTLDPWQPSLFAVLPAELSREAAENAFRELQKP